MATATDGPRVLAIDPGPTKCGWACVVGGRMGRATYLASGMESATDPDAFRAAFASAAESGAIVAIEIPTALHPRPGASPANLFARSKQLLATRDVATRLVVEARALGLEVEELTAGQWRHALTGRNNASDKMIASTLPVLCAAMPKRTNVHMRDAVGLAIVASWRTGTAKGKRA